MSARALEPVETAVVAHGLWMPGWETLLLRRRLAAAGYTTRLFKYSTTGVGLDQNVAALRRFVAAQPGTLHLVGYSLGGVLAVRMLQQAELGSVQRIVCLGAPLNGTQVAARLAAQPLGRRMLGRSILDLLAEAPLRPWSGVPPLGVVAGNVGVGLGRLLTGFDGANDGTVGVTETELAGANDHIVLSVSHTTMLFSRQVAEQAVSFLRHAKFAH